jgi:phosphoribosylaminoimidazole-succinocarboxamide synthase
MRKEKERPCYFILFLNTEIFFPFFFLLLCYYYCHQPDPNVTIAKKCTPFPIEFVMRGYLTGSTSTSIWVNYNNGMRQYCGHTLPDGLIKNQKLPMGNLLTPTTKDDVHDELISEEEVISKGFMTKADWDKCAEYSHKLFEFGQQIALQRGLILVDTKYEFGKDSQGTIFLIDEVHTPDSSRYWIADTYDALFAAGKNPENVDKELLRVWFNEHCDPYKDETLPEAPVELVNELSRRYIMLYEMITGEKFQFPEPRDVHQRIVDNVTKFLAEHKKN